MISYIVRSGAGYFLHYGSTCCEMTSDPVLAFRMSPMGARSILELLDSRGFASSLVMVQHARPRPCFSRVGIRR